jgi:hypothetical protein
MLSFNADTSDFILKETSADKLVCSREEGCRVENSGRYTLEIKVSKQDFVESNIKFEEINECSSISINIGGLDFPSRFCDADKWPTYPWQDLNAKWSEFLRFCKKFDADGACIKKQPILYRTIVAKILRTGGMVLKINGIYRKGDSINFGNSVLKDDCKGVVSSEPLPTQLTLAIDGYFLPPITGKLVCNNKTSSIKKYDEEFELTRVTISAK